MSLLDRDKPTVKSVEGNGQEMACEIGGALKAQVESKENQVKVTARYTIIDPKSKAKRHIGYYSPIDAKSANKLLEDEVEGLLDL